MSRTPAPRRSVRTPASLAAALVLLALLGLAGCSGGTLSAGSDEAGSGSVAAEAEPEAAADHDGQSFDQAQGRTAATSDRSAAAAAAPSASPAIIQTGSMTVESDDVAKARFDLGKVVDSYDGSIADEKTTASSEGRVRMSRLELRVPSDSFDEAMLDLAKLGEVTASTRKAQDVTGEVIDTRARIRAQEQSLARVEVLFSRAEQIRDIVAIEAQLSRRQADLDSLKGRLAFLEDQTSLATITVYLERTPERRAAAATPDDTAFVAGLKDGWHALAALGAGLAAVAGALLPFAVVALLLGVPAVALLRRWWAQHPLRRPAAPAPAPE